jgi:predicted transcriptional regulator
MTALHSDEDRQRANITALANADKSSRERFVRDLNATEDQIASAQKELTAAQKNLQAAKDDLASKIESLQIDENL